MKGYLYFVGAAIIKAYSYFYDTDSKWGLEVQASGSETVFKILYISITAIICIIIFYIDKKNNSAENKDSIGIGLQKFNDFVFNIGLLSFACIPMLRPEYWRFTATVVSLSGGCFFKSKLPLIRKQSTDILWIIAFGMGFLCMALWIRNLFIYSDVLGTIEMSFVSSPILVLYNSLSALIS